MSQVLVHHPRPNDLVGNPVQISGIATGFEGDVRARVRDAGGAILGEGPVDAGSMGILSPFQSQVPLGNAPTTAQGTVEVFAPSPTDGNEDQGVTVPVILGPAVGSDSGSFQRYTVKRGDTLAAIAREMYGGDAGRWRHIFEANRDQIADPDRIHPGQDLRIPV